MSVRDARRTTTDTCAPGPPTVDVPARPGTFWRVAAVLEVTAAGVAVVADWFLPSLVLSAMAVLSLLARRAGPDTLGLRRPDHPWRLTGQMLGWSAAMSILDVGLLIPVAHHLSGQRQDTSDFADLQGNAALLAVYLVLGWTLAAFAEELAFRGYLYTRWRDLLGGGRAAVVASLVLSSAMFGAIHTEQGLVGMAVAAADGMIFGLLRVWKRTLWAPVLAHGFDDTIGFLAFFLFGPFYGLW